MRQNPESYKSIRKSYLAETVDFPPSAGTAPPAPMMAGRTKRKVKMVVNMTGFKYVGYKEVTVQKREMTIGELRHRIAKVYLKKENAKIIILCLDDGERLELNSMQDALDFEWSDGCKIEVINLPHKWGVKDELGQMEDSAPTIITIQIASEESDNGETII